MSKRKLTEEEIEKIAKKDWKQPPDKIVVSRNTDDPDKFARRLTNLTGPKTEEGKKKTLNNLIVGRHNKDVPTNLKHGGYIQKILNNEEQRFYMERREAYIKDYDINESADEILLNLVLMDEVIIFRLLTRQADKPSLDISRPLTEAQNRLSKNLDSLGMLRRQRLNQEQKNTELTITKLAEMVARDKIKIQEQLDQSRKEEEEYLKMLKAKRVNAESSATEEVDRP